MSRSKYIKTSHVTCIFNLAGKTNRGSAALMLSASLSLGFLLTFKVVFVWFDTEMLEF